MMKSRKDNAMKTEMFDLVNRNHRAVVYLEKNRREETVNGIALLIFMVLVLITVIILSYILR